MSLNRSTALIALMALLGCAVSAPPVQAGPLLDWLFGHKQTAPITPVGAPVPVGTGYAAGYGAAGYAVAPVVQPPAAAYPAAAYPAATAPGYAGNYGTYYSTQLPAIGPAGAGYTAPMPSGIAAATLPSSMPPTLSYVPNFQTQSQRTPVTYYRPLMTTDPNTGAQVVAMAPCTSYEMMAQRVPVLGRSALFGSTVAPTAAIPSQALPTYTLPSGGVPLAYSTPSITAPYSTAYGVYGSSNTGGSYTTLQPGVAQVAPSIGAVAPSSAEQAAVYPTAPLAQTPYYGSTSGGSCGDAGATPWQPVPGGAPGLVAPQAPPAQYPSQVSPGYSQPEYSPAPNGSVTPSFNATPGVYPPSSGGSSDPADMPPSLPSTGTSAAAAPQFNSLHADSSQSTQRPQLRSIVRYPSSSSASAGSTTQSQTAAAHADSDDSSRDNRESRSDVPVMLPIPAPQDFHHEPRWNPGLLREEDMTALRPIDSRAVQLAGHAKPIVWASFESPSPVADQPQPTRQTSALELTPVDARVSPSHASASHASGSSASGSSVSANATTSIDHSHNQLRSIVNSATVNSAAQTTQVRQPSRSFSTIERSPESHLPESPLASVPDEATSWPRPQRDASGWKASR